MRIAINAQLLSFASSYRSGGISRVIYHLLAELARDARGHSYDVFVPTLPTDDRFSSPHMAFHATGEWSVRPSARIAWEQTLLPRALTRLRPALLHGGAYALPAAWSGPSVVSVYDLSFLLYPKAFNVANRIYLAASTRAAVRRARRVITISESTRRDIVRLLGVPADRINVAYPATEARYRVLPAADVAAFRVARDLPEAFIFAVGTLEPRKNTVGLLRAYAQLRTPRPPLMIAGGAGWRFSPIFDTVRQLGLVDSVTFLGFVPEDELPLWYNSARLFTFPSLYEGFGLPVLEAMACGVPVVTSRAASLPEVAGQAARLVDPTDTDGLAREMQLVLDDPQTRMELRAAGRIQASRFTWRAMTDQTVTTYTRAASRS